MPATESSFESRQKTLRGFMDTVLLEFVNIHEAGKRLSCEECQIARWIGEGKIPDWKISNGEVLVGLPLDVGKFRRKLYRGCSIPLPSKKPPVPVTSKSTRTFKSVTRLLEVKLPAHLMTKLEASKMSGFSELQIQNLLDSGRVDHQIFGKTECVVRASLEWYLSKLGLPLKKTG